MLSKHIDFKGMTNLRDLGGMTNVFEKKIKATCFSAVTICTMQLKRIWKNLKAWSTLYS